ncbi:MAG TPA: NADH-quinone oxidoreductase subunit M, partial [Methylococcaceae bacterium]|nr:NADH-quinone oxidoreductase subunit M [Methylococcaceae bacterium]
MLPSGFPLLSLVIFLPLVAAAGLFFIDDATLARRAALVAALLELGLCLLPLLGLDTARGDMQFLEKRTWIASLDIHWQVGVDGVSALFLPLTALLTVLVMLASWTSISHMTRLYFALLLALESVTLGIFCALDLVLFFLFWELTLPAVFFLVSLWGVGPQRRFAAAKYTLMMLAGGVPLLFGFILLALGPGDGGLSFDYLHLLDHPPPPARQSLIFLLLLLGFAVKMPLFPFHVWLPRLAMEGPTGLAALLVGIKIGAYGILRFALPLAPAAAREQAGLLTLLGIAGALYGALLALSQGNLRRMLAFSSVSHVGLVLVGLAALNVQGVQGAVFQLANFTLITGGLFLLTGFLHHRLGTTDLIHLGGAARAMPLLASGFFVLGAASIGVPGTNGFAAEHLIVLGALQAHTGLGLAVLLAAVLGAAYFLEAFRRAF